MMQTRIYSLQAAVDRYECICVCVCVCIPTVRICVFSISV